IRRYGDPYDMFAVRFAASKQALHPDFSYSRLRRAGLQRLLTSANYRLRGRYCKCVRFGAPSARRTDVCVSDRGAAVDGHRHDAQAAGASAPQPHGPKFKKDERIGPQDSVRIWTQLGVEVGDMRAVERD